MSQNLVYDPAIRNAIATGDVEKMKSLLIIAKKQLREHTKILEATLDLEDAIQTLEKKRN